MLNDLPIKQVNGAMVYIRDVANVRDGFAVQTNIVSQNRIRSALLTVLKSANASTLDIIKRVKDVLPRIKATLPPELDITQLFDQSVFVRAAINGVLKEGVIAACLTALMILLFLGSWRSTLVVATSIPLSILCSIIILGALGQTLNIMTLGGLALAVGILVDDATVEIENIHRNLATGKPMVRAILDGAQQIAVPAFVSTLCICIVFVPVFFLSGVARFLFEPLAMAVIFAMLASYFLSRTVVPTMVKFLLKAHAPDEVNGKSSFFGRIHDRFNGGFEKLRLRYMGMLSWSLNHRRVVFLVMLAAVVLGAILTPFLGRDFFPQVDAGQFRLQVRAPPGTRLEATEQRFYEVGGMIRQVIPSSEIYTILDNIGLPTSGINLAFGDNATTSSADGEILVALNPLNHRPTADYIRTLRYRLREQFPDIARWRAAGQRRLHWSSIVPARRAPGAIEAEYSPATYPQVGSPARRLVDNSVVAPAAAVGTLLVLLPRRPSTVTGHARGRCESRPPRPLVTGKTETPPERHFRLPRPIDHDEAAEARHALEGAARRRARHRGHRRPASSTRRALRADCSSPATGG